jgi:hypothetical protein
MKTNYQDPQTSEMRSTQIAGMQESLGKIEDILDMQLQAEAGIALTEVYISAGDRYRIFQAPVGKRNWAASPAPVIYKNGIAITEGFTIDSAGGAIVVSPSAISTDVFTADVSYTKTAGNKLEAYLANSAKLSINFLSEGGKVNDNTYDSMILMQSLTDNLFALGGGKLKFPPGKYYFKGKYVPRSGVVIEGAIDGQSWSGNAGLGTNIGTVFYHVPDVVDTDFIEVDQTNLLVGYAGNINMKNLYIIGSANSNIGLNTKKAANSSFKNIVIIDFKTNLVVDGLMNVKFDNVTSQRASICCLHVTGTLNTTVDFNKCYLGQTTAYANSIPLQVDADVILGLSFNDCIFESTEKGLKIDTGNVVSFNGITYIENIPATSTDPTYDIGMTTPSSTFKGVTNINGGIIQGTNNTVIDGMKLFNVNYSHALNISGVSLKRTKDLIALTTNSEGIVFSGCNEISITNNLEVCDTLKKIARINHTAGSTTIVNPTLLPISPWLPITPLNTWVAYGGGIKYRRNSIGQIELSFSATAGTIAVGTIIANLPVGYRPLVDTVFPIFDVSALRTNGHTIAINANGDIRVLNATTALVTATVYAGSIVFPAA